MKLAATALTLAAAALALLTAPVAGQACPTVRVTTKAKRIVRNNQLISVAISAKNVGTTPANNVTIVVRGPGLNLVGMTDRLVSGPARAIHLI